MYNFVDVTGMNRGQVSFDRERAKCNMYAQSQVKSAPYDYGAARDPLAGALVGGLLAMNEAGQVEQIWLTCMAAHGWKGTPVAR